MPSLTLEQKLEQYHEFFAIEHEFSVNIKTIESANQYSFDDFMAHMPTPFKLASDVNTVDQSALRSIQGLGNNAEQLVSFLNHQSQKIDLLVGYILSQQDEDQFRFKGVKFGGGGIKFNAPTAFNIGDIIELKIFLLDNNCALYCFGEVIEVESVGKFFTHKTIFHFIREEDREILVRTSLHEQSKQLQKLAKSRNQASEQSD